MRGKAIALCSSPRGHRITPAYAGKSWGYEVDKPMKQDHPRLCGEKQRISKAHGRILGSPPPMRGKADDRKKFFNAVRITPAYAGKSRKIDSKAVGKGDHPRLCGEKPSISLLH